MLRSGFTRRHWVVGGVVLAALGQQAGAVQVSSTWVGPAAGNWSVAGNWSAGSPSNGTPPDTTYNVFIDAGNAQNSVVTLDVTPTIDNLTISAADQIDVGNVFDLILVGDSVQSTLSNAGTIRLLSTGSSTDLRLNATDNTINGGGTIRLQSAATLLSVGGRITNVNNTIEGAGRIGNGAATTVTNQAAGLIHANVSGGTFTIDPTNVANAFVNDGTLQASGGGILVLTGIGGGAFTNNNLIQALNGSEVQLTNNASVTGGTFSTAGTGVVRVTPLNVFFTGITNTGKMVGDNSSDFGVSGTITNSGTIDINATTNKTDLELQVDTTLTGGGTVTLADLDTASSANNAGIDGIAGTPRLTNFNNTIQGQGSLAQGTIAVTNQAGGVINGNVPGGTLTVDPANVTDAFINEGTLQASGGGILLLTGAGGGAFTNNNLIQALNGSEVQLIGNASVTGGTFSTTGSGVVRVNASQNIFFANITNTGKMVGSNASDFGVSGTITNSGAIDINATTSGTDMELQVDTTLTGGGTVTLADLDTASTNNQAGIDGLAGGLRLTNVNNTIQGHGAIGRNTIAVTNEAGGVIHANVPGGTLTLDPANVPNAFVNNGVLRASNGGTLVLTGTGSGSFSGTGSVQIDAGGTANFVGFAQSISQFTSGDVTNNGTVGVATGNGTVSVARLSGTGTTSVTQGTLTASGGIEQGALSIGVGAKVIIPNSSPFPAGDNAAHSRLGSLSITSTGKLDLGNNDIIIDYTGASPIATYEALVASAYNVVGNWAGDGITSSVAAADGNYVVAIADNAALAAPFGTAQGGPLFAGVDVDIDTILIKFTHRADINLDGLVTPDDSAVFGGNYDESITSGFSWAQGDMNYDGVCTPDDAAIFGGAYDESLTSLPEPASIALLAIAGLAMPRRRRIRTR